MLGLLGSATYSGIMIVYCLCRVRKAETHASIYFFVGQAQIHNTMLWVSVGVLIMALAGVV
jgi:hypothetical protein